MSMLAVEAETYEKLIAHGPDTVVLYMHILYAANLQGSNLIWSNVKYLAKGTRIGIGRTKAAKAFLVASGLVDYVPQRGEAGRHTRWLIRVRALQDHGEPVVQPLFQWDNTRATGTESHPHVGEGVKFSSEKTEEKKRESAAKDAAYLPLAQELAAAVKQSMPRARCNPAGWTRDLRLLVERDGATEAEVRRVIAWLPSAPTNQGSGFCWARVILSGSNLRRHFPRLLAEVDRERPGGNGHDETAEEAALALIGRGRG